jgi:hypothetical protein
MKTRTRQETELTTFIIDKLKSEHGRRELRNFLRDTEELMDLPTNVRFSRAIRVGLHNVRVATAIHVVGKLGLWITEDFGCCASGLMVKRGLAFAPDGKTWTISSEKTKNKRAHSVWCQGS